MGGAQLSARRLLLDGLMASCDMLFDSNSQVVELRGRGEMSEPVCLRTFHRRGFTFWHASWVPPANCQLRNISREMMLDTPSVLHSAPHIADSCTVFATCSRSTSLLSERRTQLAALRHSQ